MGRNVDNIGGVAQASANAGAEINRRNIRFVDGGGVAWTTVDDPLNNRVDVSASASGAGVPTGTVVAKASTVIPAGWLRCDGASYPTATYPALFADIGYTYGGAGPNFNVPNYTRRGLMGDGGAGTATIGNTVGAVGGEEAHAQTVGEMATHAHSNSGTHDHNTTTLAGGVLASDGGPGATTFILIAISRTPGGTTGSTTSVNGANITINNNGSGTPANVIQPSAIVMWIIKT